jgi:hypothetical protein
MWQPWATLKVKQGGRIKQYETRSWGVSYRGPVAIQAARRPTRTCLYEIGDAEVLRQIILALRDCGVAPTDMSLRQCAEYFTKKERLPIGAVIGVGDLIACHPITPEFAAGISARERALGDFTPGRFAWEFKDMSEVYPVKAAGKQGLWTLDVQMLERIII